MLFSKAYKYFLSVASKLLLILQTPQGTTLSTQEIRTTQTIFRMPINPNNYWNRPDGHEDRLPPLGPIYSHFIDGRPRDIRDWVRDPGLQSYTAPPYIDQSQYVPRTLLERRVDLWPSPPPEPRPGW